MCNWSTWGVYSRVVVVVVVVFVRGCFDIIIKLDGVLLCVFWD